MRITIHRHRKISGLLLALALCGVGAANAAESFDYKVSYDGVFTAFKEVGIGDARLDIVQTGAVVDAEPIVRARLTASSEAYPLVESFYPFRYEFTSYHQRNLPRTLAYERRKETRRGRHDVLVADWQAGAVRRYDVAPTGEVPAEGALPDAMLALLRLAGMPDYRARLVAQPWRVVTSEHALDRLALLQQLRTVVMEEGAIYPMTVTDGKQLIRYQARVARREQVNVGDTTRMAWKVRIDGFETGETGDFTTSQEGGDASVRDDTRRLRHPPVYVWIDEGPRRVPLRLVSHHAVGTFTVALEGERTLQSAGLDASRETPVTR